MYTSSIEVMSKAQRERLETEKLLIEIEQLKRPWYKKLDIYQILLPSSIALISVGYAIFSGFLDLTRKDLEIEKKQLIYDIDKFNDRKDELNAEYDSIKLAYATVQEEFNLVKGDLDRAIQTLSSKDSMISHALSREQELLFQRYAKKVRDIETSVNGSLYFLHEKCVEEVMTETWGEGQERFDHYVEMMNDSGWIELDNDSVTLLFAQIDRKAYDSHSESIERRLLSFRDSLIRKQMTEKEIRMYGRRIALCSPRPYEPFVRKCTDIGLTAPRRFESIVDRIALSSAKFE